MEIQQSYWEKTVWSDNWDVIILGAGLVGLQSARQLLEGNPGLKVLMLERGSMPSGASTRNAGFACFGSLSELLAHERVEGTASMMALVKKRIDGLRALRESVPDEVIGYEPLGGYEVFTEADAETFDRCHTNRMRMNQLLEPLTGLPETFIPVSKRISAFGLGETRHLILNQAEGQLNSGKLILELWKRASQAGAVILGGIQVHSISKQMVHTSAGDFKTNQILVTTNGFAKELLPAIDVKPGRGQVLVTAPISNLKIKGSFHYEDGFYYFRDVDGRILLGGGRNLDFSGEETTRMDTTETIQTRLEHLLRTVILPGSHVKIEHRWAGIMAFGSEKSPIIEEIQPGIWVAVRMSGMGVALGTLVAKEVASRMVL